MDLPPLGVDEKLPIIKKNRVSTGISDIDLVLEGGYLNPGNVLLLGANSMEKVTVAYHFATAGLKSKSEHVLFLTLDATPTNIKEKSSSSDIKLNGDNLSFIDCYSSTIGQPSKEANVTAIPGAQSLEDISFAISETINKNAGKKLRVIFYSLSSMLLYNPRDSMLKFLQVVGGRLRNANATVMYLVEEGVHDKKTLSMVEHIMDEKYSVMNKDGIILFEIPGSGLSLPIKLGPNGITVL